MEKWRLLEIEYPSRAGLNLAIDEALLRQTAKNKGSPIVRFWRNRNAAVIGYSQCVEAEVNLELCRVRRIQIVRRITGGGAVYHDLGNLNYSIVIGSNHPLMSRLDIQESYKVFLFGIVECLKKFGVNPSIDPSNSLLVQDRKISGSAQARKRGIILHHGTILVNSNLNLLSEVLKPQKKPSRQIGVPSKRGPVTNLSDEVTGKISMQAVKESLRRSFEEVFSVKTVRSTLTSEERKVSQILYDEKYSRKEWNFWR
ncbi:TPA: lipoate--protein ligase family protein [Candidatus Bathyarchaeota archaeon]|nr:lipoate--protein ligase family protein [Candidatus Bathyarchaeota archaeon]